MDELLAKTAEFLQCFYMHACFLHQRYSSWRNIRGWYVVWKLGGIV